MFNSIVSEGNQAFYEAERNHKAWKSAENEEDFKEALLQYLRCIALRELT